jgi:nucleotidyltransferase/DNA polymerase involved in DNA repair
MVRRGLCTGREFVKLIDQGFDRFPLKSNRGREIARKFAEVVEQVGVDAVFLGNKLSGTAHEKCIIFALEVVGMLGMTGMKGKVGEMVGRHPKKAVREVAAEILEELGELENEEQSV